MSGWKKILLTTVLLIIALILALYAFLSFYDFNNFKPAIAGVVKDAIGRELTISGNVEFELGIRPTLVVENVSLQNASWSSTPDLAQVKRLEVQIAVLPLIIGKFDFAHLVLVEPAVIVEFNSSGTSNFSFDTSSEEKDESAIPPPPLIFSDVLIEKGLFTYKDVKSSFNFSVRIDRLAAEIPGFDKPLQLKFKGAFDDVPLTLDGTVGPIWAWVEPGYSLPANFTVKSAGTSVRIKGELRDPVNLKDLTFDIAARGSSVSEVAKLAGLPDVPELGAFKLDVRVSDPEDHLGVEKLNIQIGTEELAAISLTGDIKDLFALQGINLNFSVLGKDSTKLTQFGLPALLERGAFRVSARISDTEAKVITVSDLSVVLGENEFNGQVNLNLAEKIPFLTAGLASQKFRFGQFNLDLKMTGPVEKPAIKKLDLKIGTPDLAEIHLNGIIDDLIKLQGVNIDFQARGKDLANLEQVIGQPPPVRGSFSAAGKVLIPVHKNLEIPDLKITIGKNDIRGSLNLDLRGVRPQLKAKLSLPKLDLPSVLLPELAGQGWAKGLDQVRPVKLAVSLAGFSREIVLKKVDLQAGSLKSAEVRLTGSVEDLVARRGIDLKFSLRGNELTKLKEIIGQPFLFVPVPGQGTYAISGKISDPAPSDFKVNDFKLKLADTELTGRLGFNLATQSPQYEVDLSTRKFNLKPVPIPKEATYANLNKIDDLGPLKIHSKVIVKGSQWFLSKLELQAGSEQLLAVRVKGSIKDLTTQSGIDLNFNIQGNEVANLVKITGQSIPLKGSYALSGRLKGSAKKQYKLGNLAFKLGKNNITGSLDLDLSGNQLRLATDLVASKFSLRPVTFPDLETLSRIEDLGPLKLAFKLVGAGKKLALADLNFNLGRKNLIEVLLKGSISDLSAVKGIKLEFSVKGNDLSNFKKMGGPDIPYPGPFNVSGQFIDSAPNVYKIPAFDAAWGDNKSKGWLELVLSGKRPHLKAELSVDKLDLRPLLAEDKQKATVKVQSTEPVVQKDQKSKAKAESSKSRVQNGKVFPSEPLPLAGLRTIDVDLKLRSKQVLFRTIALRDVIMDALLKDGNLEIRPFKFTIGGGNADVRFNLRSQEKPAALAATLAIDQLEIGPMLDQLGYQRSVEGNMDTTFNLDGSGDSVADLMAGLNGNIRIAMSDGRADSKYLELLEKYLGSGVLGMLNPFQQKRKYTQINWFVNHITIKHALADVKILIDTDQTSIFSAGDVNLKTESLDLGIKPTPKKGALPANISFSFKEFSQPFRLGGTLANPHLAIDPGRTAFVIGKMAGALALGPIGIAAFFADVSVGKQDPCAVALGVTAKTDQASGAKKAGESSKETAAGDEKKKEKKSGVFFKRLFGK